MMAARSVDPQWSLAALLDGIVPGVLELDRSVTGLGFDSRAVAPGTLFFARRGTRVDASTFARAAHDAGAVAMVEQGSGSPHLDAGGLLRIPVDSVDRVAGEVAHRFHGRPSELLDVVAVTGTNGKTSVCHFVASALERLVQAPVGVLGTLGRSLGGEVSDTGLTTPDGLSLHRCLAEFCAAGARVALMEASSHALAQERLAGVHVHTAVFTNLTRDHLDYHGDMPSYARAKARLFAMPHVEHALINVADAAAPTMLEAAGDTPVTTFALDAEAMITGRLMAVSARGLEVEIRQGDERATIRSSLLGAAAAWNLLAAFGVLQRLGITAQRAAEALSAVGAPAGRMQSVGGEGRPIVVVDYSHTPAALAGAAEALRALCSGTLWCVFGAGGDRDPGKRPLMGAAAAQHCDRLVVTDDNPRGEDGDRIVEGILQGVPDPARDRVVVERDRARAIALAVERAGVGDVILVAGKGHEHYQEVDGVRRPFSDVAVARAALAGWRS